MERILIIRTTDDGKTTAELEGTDLKVSVDDQFCGELRGAAALGSWLTHYGIHLGVKVRCEDGANNGR